MASSLRGVASSLSGWSWSIVAGAVAVRPRDSHVLARTDADRHGELGRDVETLRGRMWHRVLRVNDHSGPRSTHQCRVCVLHAGQQGWLDGVLDVSARRLTAVQLQLVATGAACNTARLNATGFVQSLTRVPINDVALHWSPVTTWMGVCLWTHKP